MGVVIPRDYSQDARRGPRRRRCRSCWMAAIPTPLRSRWAMPKALVRGYSLELRTDGAEPARRRSALAPPVDARLRVWYNSSLESKNYVVPGLIAVILQIIAALLTSLTIAREWEMGTMEQIALHAAAPRRDGAGQDARLLRGGAGGCGDRRAGGDLRVPGAVPRQRAAAGGFHLRVPVRRAVLGHLCFGRARKTNCRPTRWAF